MGWRVSGAATWVREERLLKSLKRVEELESFVHKFLAACTDTTPLELVCEAERLVEK